MQVYTEDIARCAEAIAETATEVAGRLPRLVKGTEAEGRGHLSPAEAAWRPPRLMVKLG